MQPHLNGLQPPVAIIEASRGCRPNAESQSIQQKRPLSIPFGLSSEDLEWERLIHEGFCDEKGVLSCRLFDTIEVLPIPASSLQKLKKFFCAQMTIQGVLTKDSKKWIRKHVLSQEFSALHPNLPQEKIKAFLAMPMLQKEEDSPISHSFVLAPYFLRLLDIMGLDDLFLVGGKARQILVVWFQEMLKRNLKEDLKFSERFIGLIAETPPDADFLLTCPSATEEKLFFFDDQMVSELCDAFFAPYVKELLPLYELLIRAAFCKFNTTFTGTKSDHTLTIGKAPFEKIDIVTSNQKQRPGLFEFNKLQIAISKSVLARWIKFPTAAIHETDFKEVRILFDQPSQDLGLQASFDLTYGFLRHPSLEAANEKTWPRYLSWIARGYRSPVKQIENLLFQRTFSIIASRSLKEPQMGEELAKLLLNCHDSHNKGNLQLLKAMAVQALLKLETHKAFSTENSRSLFIAAFWEAIKKTVLKTAGPPSLVDRILQMVDQEKACLGSLKAFLQVAGFLLACDGSNSRVQITSCEEKRALQIFDGSFLLLEFDLLPSLIQFQELISKAENTEYFESLLDYFLTNLSFGSLNREILKLDWESIQKIATQYCSSPNKVLIQIGYALLLAYRAFKPFPEQLLDLLFYLPKISRINKTLFSSFQKSFDDTPHAACVAIALSSSLEPSDNELFPLDILAASSNYAFANLIFMCWSKHISEGTLSRISETSISLIQAFLPYGPIPALKIFSKLKENKILNDLQNKQLFEEILRASHQKAQQPEMLSCIPLLLDIAKQEVEKAVSNLVSAKRKSHKKAAPIGTWDCREAFIWLIEASFQINPDEEGVKLFCDAIRSKILTSNNGQTAATFARLLRIIVLHPSRPIGVLSRLWREGGAFKIDLVESEFESKEQILLELCENLFSKPHPDLEPIFDRLMESLCREGESEGARSLALRVAEKRFRHLIEPGDREKAIACVELLQPLLPSDFIEKCYDMLFECELAVKNFKKASEILRKLVQEKRNSKTRNLLKAWLKEMKANQQKEYLQQQRACLLETVESAFEDDIFSGLSPETADSLQTIAEMINFILVHLCANGIDLPKVFKGKIRGLFEKAILAYLKSGLFSQTVIFMSLSQKRGMMPTLQDKTAEGVIAACEAIIKNPASALIELEAAAHIIESYPIFNKLLSSLNEEAEIYAGLARRFFAIPSQEKRAYGWIHRALDLMASHRLQALTAAEIASFADRYKGEIECDARAILDKALCCHHLLGSKILKRAYGRLIGHPGFTLRSAEILVEERHHLEFSDPSDLKNKAIATIEELMEASDEKSCRLSLMILLLYQIEDSKSADRIFQKIRNSQHISLKNELWKILTEAKILDKFPLSAFKSYVIAIAAEILHQVASPDLSEILKNHKLIVPYCPRPDLLLAILLPGSLVSIVRREVFCMARALEVIAIRKACLTLFQDNLKLLRITDLKLLNILLEPDKDEAIDAALKLSQDAIESFESDLLLEFMTLAIEAAAKRQKALPLAQFLCQVTASRLSRTQDASPILSQILQNNEPALLILGTVIAKSYLDQQPPPKKENISRIIKDLIIQNLLTKNKANITGAIEIFNHQQIGNWMTGPHYAAAWGMYTRLYLTQSLVEGSPQERKGAIVSFKSSCLPILPDKESLECCFAAGCDVLFQILNESIACRDEAIGPDFQQIMNAFLSFHTELMQLIDVLTKGRSKMPAASGMGRQLAEQMLATSYPQEQNPYEILKKIIQAHSSSLATDSPETVSERLNVALNFENGEKKDLFYRLNSILIKRILRSNPAYVDLGKLILYFVQMQLQLLLENYPERLNETVELIDLFVFTSSPHFQEGHSMICSNFLNYSLSCFPLLRKKPEKVYEWILFIYAKGIEYPILPNAKLLEISLMTFKRIIDPHSPWLVKRAADILSSLPFNLVKDAHEALRSYYIALVNAMKQLPFTQVAVDIRYVNAICQQARPIFSYEYIAQVILHHEALHHKERSQAMCKTGTYCIKYYTHTLLEIIETEPIDAHRFSLNAHLIAFLTAACSKGMLGPFYHEVKGLIENIKTQILISLPSQNPVQMLKTCDLKTFFLAPVVLNQEHKILRAQMIVDWVKQLVQLKNKEISQYAFEQFHLYSTELKLHEECRPQYTVMERLFGHVLEKF